MFNNSLLTFSSSYGGTKENFVVKLNYQFNSNFNVIDDKKFVSLLSVAQNIIQRGKPTHPSEYLTSALGKISSDKKPLCLIDCSDMHWNVIKGDEVNNYFPARKFYEDTLVKYFNNYAFVRNLIIPEASFIDIVGENTTLKQSQVDFYLPQAKTVVEVDGGSHEDDTQIETDKERDNELGKKGIKVIRIKTKDLEEENDAFKEKLRDLYRRVATSSDINEYKECMGINKNDLRVTYDAIIRIQVAFIQAFKYGLINVNSQYTKVYVEESDIDGLAKKIILAYEDLSQLIKVISQLSKSNICLPQIKFVDYSDTEAITLDLRMFRRYTDTDNNWNSDSPVIYIRTAYYYDKDYYYVSSADSINYTFTAADEQSDNECFSYLVKNLFGHDEFREGQLPIIKNVLTRNDTIGILPTGTGKSMCYQLSALLQPGVVMVVVPIISLMQDQKKGLEKNGISKVADISSKIKDGQKKSDIIKEFKSGKFQFMLISPERTQNQEFRQALLEIAKSSLNMSMVVIDEVHCLSEWGHDFRVSYLRLIPIIRKYCKGTTLLGLTATASQAVLNDLKAEFDNDGSGIKALTSMDRPELIFKRIKVKDNNERETIIKRLVNKHQGTYKDDSGNVKNNVGIVFCSTVGRENAIKYKNPNCRRIYYMLSGDTAVPIEIYHGQLSGEQKEISQRNFMNKNFSGVMICTSAFGMGIDKENVKYTIHASLPKSLESYYQEAGRAGRDKDKSIPSVCYIIYKPETAPKEKIDKLFKNDTSVIERREIAENLNFSDLSINMYLWNLNKEDVDNECEGIYNLYTQLKSGVSNLPFDSDEELTKKQNYLYKLTTLGAVSDWTVQYRTISKGFIKDVQYDNTVGADKEKLKANLLKYIHKHDPEFTFDKSAERYKRYYDIFNDSNKEPIQNIIRIEIEWGNNNILYSRLQSMHNMMLFCYAESTEDEFKQKLSDYFRYTEQVVYFDTIVQRPLEYNNWFDILFPVEKSGKTRNVITKEKAASTLAMLMRYLESYGNNTGLNYLHGMLRLMTDEYTNIESEWRFTDSLRNLRKEDIDSVIMKSTEFATHLKNNYRNLFSEAILVNYPDYARQIYSKLKDDYSLSLLVHDNSQKINKLIEERIYEFF